MDAHYTGNKITELRKSKNWTRKDIAEKLHVSVAAVSKWERVLNFPDLSLMEPLSEILEISVSELLGLENESADQVIKDITAISEEEKKASNRRYWKGFCAAAVTAVLFIASAFLVFLSVSHNRIMRMIFEGIGGSGILNLIAVMVGLAAWTFALISIFSAKKDMRWKTYSLISLLCCAVSLHIPILTTYLTMRFEYSSTVEDVIGADYFGSAILLIGTILFNLCSAIIHREKKK